MKRLLRHGIPAAVFLAVAVSFLLRRETVRQGPGETTGTRGAPDVRGPEASRAAPARDPVFHPAIPGDASLESIVRHRNGNLNLVLPAGIGRATFVQDLSEVSVALLDEISQRLSKARSRA